jgi:hypothetical protein
MKKIYWTLGLTVLLGTLIGGYLYLTSTEKVQASENVDLKVKLEASIDNGTTWHNYSGDTNPDGESVTAQPGDTVQLRLKAWNESSTHSTTDTSLLGTSTNSKYIASASTTDADEDNNGTSYTGALVDEGAGVGLIDLSVDGSESANYESATFDVKLENNFPVGQTVLIGTTEITGEGTEVIIVGSNDNLIRHLAHLLAPSSALADGLGNQSKIRIVVNVNGETEELPQTGGRD